MLSSDPTPAGTVRELLYRRTPRVVATPAIIAIDVVLYVAMVASSGELFFTPATLFAWGGQAAEAIGSGEWWRLLTAMFLHGHLLHLLLNMLVLWQLGAIVERLLGPLVFLVLYLLCGVVASVTSVHWHQSANVSVGASGAIFGLAGILLAVILAANPPWRRQDDPTTLTLADLIGDLRGSVLGFIVYNAAIGFALPQIDVAAHLGGLAGGVVFGLLVGHHALRARPRLIHVVIPVLLTTALAAWEVRAREAPRDVRGELVWFQLHADGKIARFEAPLRAVLAIGRRSAEAAADVERTVLPPLQDARTRAGRLVEAGAPDARAWADFLDAHERAWRLRVRALRDGDAALARQAHQLESDAMFRFAPVLRRQRAR